MGVVRVKTLCRLCELLAGEQSSISVGFIIPAVFEVDPGAVPDPRFNAGWRPESACRTSVPGPVLGPLSGTGVPVGISWAVPRGVVLGRTIFVFCCRLSLGSSLTGTLGHGYLKSGPLPKVPLLGQSTLVR